MDDIQEINVGEIVEQIRENIRKQQRSSPVAATNPSSDSLVAADLAVLEDSRNIYDIHFTSHRKFLGPLIILAKKVVRQLLTPSLERQSGYNAANNRVALHLWHQADTLEKICKELAEQIGKVQQEKMTALQTLGRELAEQLGGVHQEQVAGLQALRRELVEELGGVHQRQVTGLQALRRELTEQLQGVRQDLAEQHGEVRQEQVSSVQALREELAEQLGGVHQEQVAALQLLRAQLVEQIAQSHQEHAVALQAIRERASRVERKVRRFLYSLTESQETDGQEVEKPALRPQAIPPRNPEFRFDYFGFEERFRGSEEDIKKRQRVYVEYFKESDQVLDIGCGRGEFLELLAATGIKAKGVDLDLDMVLYCQEKGLDVVSDDAFAYLDSLPDESLGGLFAAQVIEHLEASRIIELVKLCQRKLQSGGTLIFETPNPTCLMVFARSFYMDFSHIRPIHPEAIKFLFESAGFQNIQLKFSSAVEACMRIPPLPERGPDAKGAEAFNKGIERLNDLLYGFQDYAVIGRKSPHL
jgi:2-polyprenyl-3-methyl-5-hydroxy-6-metoxy-1,4-benzoquinol methylase